MLSYIVNESAELPPDPIGCRHALEKLAVSEDVMLSFGPAELDGGADILNGDLSPMPEQSEDACGLRSDYEFRGGTYLARSQVAHLHQLHVAVWRKHIKWRSV
jgi:hypothetical protein